MRARTNYRQQVKATPRSVTQLSVSAITGLLPPPAVGTTDPLQAARTARRIWTRSAEKTTRSSPLGSHERRLSGSSQNATKE